MILVFGILGIVINCFVFGIVAWVMGNGDLTAMREGTMDASGEGLTQAGRICGIVSVALAALSGCGVIIFFLVLAVGGAAAGAVGAGGAGLLW